jgi:sulfur-carrier protein adenylyltransferase/sulfurtransferase
MMEAYERQMSLPEMGLEKQKRLNASSILVIGIGGLGCAALPYLAASGIHRIGMIDCDRVEASNLARQTLFGKRDIGRWKVEVAKERLTTLYANVLFQEKICQITHRNAQELIAEYDLIIDGTDNLQSRLAINDASFSLQKPWIYGSIQQWEGQIALFLPTLSDYRSLFPEGPSTHSLCDCTSGGVLGPFVGLIGAIQALEAIKWLAGIEENLGGKLLTIDGKTWRFKLAHFASLKLDYEISYIQLKKWIFEEPIQLIDVRDPHEKQNGDLGGTHLASTPLNRAQKVILYCQSGRRSLTLMRQLRKEGFEAYSLQGGVNAVIREPLA